MAQHIKELFIHGYKGIHELKLEQLNSINILTAEKPVSWSCCQRWNGRSGRIAGCYAPEIEQRKSIQYSRIFIICSQ